MTLHTLYRFYDRAGGLLYVGMTNNPSRRFAKHRDEKEWWQEVSRIELEHHPTREALRDAERDAIRAEGPEHNVQMNARRERSATTSTVDPLVGMWFVIWTENDGRSSLVPPDYPLKPKWQGKITERLDFGRYLVRTYSFRDGRPSDAAKIAYADRMHDWTFYPTSQVMIESLRRTKARA